MSTPGSGQLYSSADGRLHYTKAGLFALFGWLLWGDFCFTIMEQVMKSLLPIQLKAIGASNTSLSVMLNILPNLLGFTVGPWVSFKSDRCTHRWGRRKPYILWTMPFLCLSLVGVGFTEEIAMAVREWPLLAAYPLLSASTVTLLIVGSMIVSFAFFNEFVNSVFWYMFVDVVPENHLGRFMGLFKVVGAFSAFLFSMLAAPYVESHAANIYLVVALLYFFGFGLMCLFVKEAQYVAKPGEEEPEPVKGQGLAMKLAGVKATVRTYIRECFLSHPIYVAIFLTAFLTGLSSPAGFGIFFALQIGVTVEQVFIIGAWFSLAGMVCHYPAGLLSDRFHPVRLTVLFSIITIPGPFLAYFFKVDLPSYILVGIIWFPVAELNAAAGNVLMNRLFPKHRYGQFSSCRGMFRQAGRLVGALCIGLFLDWTVDYRTVMLYTGILNLLETVAVLVIFVWWCRLGGDAYQAPIREGEDISGGRP
jgi:maltose/moltooligosaccharide transporter